MEVADRLLDHDLCRSSVTVKHIQSNLSNVQNLLKTEYELEHIEQDSTDIYYSNSIDVYINRPDELFNIKYRDFFSTYVRVFKNLENNEYKFRKLKKPLLTRVNFYNKLCDEESEAYYSQTILCNICLTKENFDINNTYIFSSLNNTKTFKEECILLNLKDEDSPSFDFSKIFLTNTTPSEEDGEFNEHLPAEVRTQAVFINTENFQVDEEVVNDFISNEDMSEEINLVAGNNINEDINNNISDLDEDAIVMQELKMNFVIHYHDSLELFTESQKFAFKYIINKWEIENEPAQLIMQGAAGTGKSYVVDSLRGYLIENNINHAVIAYSGSAASLVCGHTIHSFFEISADEHMTFKVKANSETWHRIKDVQVFLVDEYTMIENVIFNGINEILNIMHPSNEWQIFGNKSIIFTGDVAQTSAIHTNIYDNKIFKESLEVITLHECMRQLVTAEPVIVPTEINESQILEYIETTKALEEAQQKNFYTALTNIRTNSVTLQDEELLYSQVLNTQFSLDNIPDVN